MGNFSKKVISVNNNIALYASRINQEDTLAMFLKFKKVRMNGNIYLNKVPPELNITRPTFLKWVKTLKDIGWATVTKDRIQLHSIRKIARELANTADVYRFFRVTKIKNGTKSELRTKIRWISLQQQHRRHAFVQTANRLCISYKREHGIPKPMQKKIMAHTKCVANISLRSIAESIKRSKSTANREKQNMNDLGIIKVKKNKPVIERSNVSFGEWLNFLNYGNSKGSYYFFRNEGYKKGMIMQRIPDAILITKDKLPIPTL